MSNHTQEKQAAGIQQPHMGEYKDEYCPDAPKEVEAAFLRLPMIPLRGATAFPQIIMHIDIARGHSHTALEKAMLADEKLMLIAQRDSAIEKPSAQDFYIVGTIVKIKQVIKLPGGIVRALVEGEARAVVGEFHDIDGCWQVEARPLKTQPERDPLKATAYLRCMRDCLSEYADASKRVPKEMLSTIGSVDQCGLACDLIAANALIRLEDKQAALECIDAQERLELVCNILSRESQLVALEEGISEKVKARMEKHQRDYYLHEKLRAIHAELGDDEANAIGELSARAQNTPLNAEAASRVNAELKRLKLMSPSSPETAVSRTYVETILDLPWGKITTDNTSLKDARDVLSADHYGLNKVKERVIEHIAVNMLNGGAKGSILCLVGPPGVGKTSIARSIARALNRKFAHMSLGGMRDEAEIRGHRRTYIGAIPGRIISSIKQCGSMNPVFLLDEIDKLAGDFRGDPAGALLEALDSEQNFEFRDHYIEAPFDLSKVLFLTTANSLDTITRPLLDRLEVLHISGYTAQEKLRIAKKYLLPKQRRKYGIKATQLRVSGAAILAIVENYTREAGVRNLEREIAGICRKAACEILEGVNCVSVTARNLTTYLGKSRNYAAHFEKTPQVGLINGLAYTPYGGEVLQIEAAVLSGSGKIEQTGQLGEVMRESIYAANSCLRAMGCGLKKDMDLHIHVPQGAVPKDGPSAGIAIACAIYSALTGKTVRQDVALTGEVTLRGRALPIGGLKEKALAAHRAGIKTVLYPEGNARDIEDIPEDVRAELTLKPIATVKDALMEVINEGYKCELSDVVR